jgi:DNA polymerase Ligase (LigD)
MGAWAWTPFASVAPGRASMAEPDRPVFVLHDHRKPQPHFDLRLEEDGVLRSWAVPKGMPPDSGTDRLAVAVSDHDLGHATYTDADKDIADTGWWELEDRNDRRFVFVLHGRHGSRRYALIDTRSAWLLHLTRAQPSCG